MNKRRVVVLMPNEKPQLPPKHYLEEDSYHLQQQRLQPVIQNIQKRRKLNEASSNSIEFHLEQQQQQIKIQIQTTQPIATFEIPELDIHGKSWSQKPTNVVRSRPSLIGRFRGNVCISSHQLSDETVQLNQLKINHFESVKEKVPINNNNNSLVLPYQKNMTPENDESQKTIDNLSSNFNNQLNENIHQQEVSTSTTNKCMIPVDTPSITVADHDLGNENREFSILNIIPSLISEKNRKAAFVENLVDTAGLIIEVIWANFSVNPSAKIIPLRLFLQETLRRSRTSYSTLQTALFYLFRIKPQISPISRRSEYPLTPTSELPPDVNQSQNNDPATCGRRMFLASLIVASKYLQDRNYSNRAWSKISGLPVSEINANEICFLKLIDYNLFIAEDIFKRWSSLLLSHIQAISGSDINNPDAFRRAENQREVAKFRETLRSMDPKTMDYKHTCVGICPATPADSAPSSPKECSSEVMQASNSYTLSSIIQQPTPPISYGNFVDRTNRTLDNYVN